MLLFTREVVRLTLMNDTTKSNALCPNCQKIEGEPWSLCTNPSCKDKGYHLIPRHYFKIIKKYPKRNHELVGQVIDNRYLLVQKIGAGGMGFVFLGVQSPFMREVAVKIVSEAHLDDSNRERFAREARALSMLDHPYIVKMLDYGVHKIDAYQRDLPFMVIEYVNGGLELGRFFKQMKKAGKQVSSKLVVHIFSQLLSALETAHAQGLIHRDIKPANILLKKVAGNPFMVKLLDFGLAKALSDAQGASEQGLTSDGMLVGTPQYLSPEQGDIRKLFEGKIDGRSDLYSVGIVLYEVLTGVRPFPFDDQLKILVMKSSPRFDPFKVPEAAALPDVVKDFLRKSLAVNPDDRFQNAQVFRRAMKKALLESNVGVKGLNSSEDELLGGGSSESVEVDWDLIEIAADSEEEFAFASISSVSNQEIPPLPDDIDSGLFLEGLPDADDVPDIETPVDPNVEIEQGQEDEEFLESPAPDVPDPEPSEFEELDVDEPEPGGESGQSMEEENFLDALNTDTAEYTEGVHRRAESYETDNEDIPKRAGAGFGMVIAGLAFILLLVAAGVFFGLHPGKSNPGHDDKTQHEIVSMMPRMVVSKELSMGRRGNIPVPASKSTKVTKKKPKTTGKKPHKKVKKHKKWSL